MADKIETFKNDVEGLLEEVYTLNSFYLLHKHLKNKTTYEENLNAMKRASAFFQLTMNSFQYSALMGLAKLYEPNSRNSKNINKFLNYIEAHHREIFDNSSATKCRLGRDTDINTSIVRAHMERIEQYQRPINNLIAWRDKKFAHNDKKYFSTERELAKDFPITFGEIEELINLASEILNTYQVGFNGTHTVVEPTNTFDVDNVIESLKN